MYDHWRYPENFRPVLTIIDGTNICYTDKNFHNIIREEYFRLLDFIRSYCENTEVEYNNLTYTIKEINSYSGILVCTLSCEDPFDGIQLDLTDLYK